MLQQIAQSNTDTPDSLGFDQNPNVYEQLCRRLLERDGRRVGLMALAGLLEGVLARLVSELSGPDKDSALDTVWRCEPLFLQALEALRLTLDTEPGRSDDRTEYFGRRFEQQLSRVRRLCNQGSGERSLTYLDRVQTKDSLHQLLDTLRDIVKADIGQTITAER